MVRRYQVMPAKSGGWAIIESGRRVDTVPTKQTAVNVAYAMARQNDKLEIRRRDGTVQNVRTVRQ